MHMIFTTVYLQERTDPLARIDQVKHLPCHAFNETAHKRQYKGSCGAHAQDCIRHV